MITANQQSWIPGLKVTGGAHLLQMGGGGWLVNDTTPAIAMTFEKKARLFLRNILKDNAARTNVD